MREYLLVFLVGAVVTSLLTVFAREIALRVHAVAPVRDRDVHTEPIPYLGGVAMYGGLLAAYFVARQLPFLSARGGDEIFEPAQAVMIAGAIICLVGVLDDIFDLNALAKFGGQVVAASVMVVQGVQYVTIPQLDGGYLSLDAAQANLLTVLLVVATVNAVNFVDGLDGLAAGVVGIGAISFLVFSYQLANLNDQRLAVAAALICAALAGACAGFLFHNFHPARIFMGDSGSMLIGLVLSGAAISITGQFQPIGGGTTSGASIWPTLLPLILPAVIFVVPIVDMVLAVVRRTREGRSPFSADKKHLHHRLLEIGHSHRRAVVIMWGWTFTIAFGTVAASLYAGPVVLIVWAVGVVLSIVATVVVPIAQSPLHHEDEQRTGSRMDPGVS